MKECDRKAFIVFYATWYVWKNSHEKQRLMCLYYVWNDPPTVLDLFNNSIIIVNVLSIITMILSFPAMYEASAGAYIYIRGDYLIRCLFELLHAAYYNKNFHPFVPSLFFSNTMVVSGTLRDLFITNLIRIERKFPEGCNYSRHAACVYQLLQNYYYSIFVIIRLLSLKIIQ